MALTRDQILAADDLRPIEVQVPEWGDSVYVRVMTAGEREWFEAEAGGRTKDAVMAKLVVVTACDADGNRLFGLEDVEALAAKSGAAVSRVFMAAAKHNRLRKEDVDEFAGN